MNTDTWFYRGNWPNRSPNPTWCPRMSGGDWACSSHWDGSIIWSMSRNLIFCCSGDLYQSNDTNNSTPLFWNIPVDYSSIQWILTDFTMFLSPVLMLLCLTARESREYGKCVFSENRRALNSIMWLKCLSGWSQNFHDVCQIKVYGASQAFRNLNQCFSWLQCIW